jgi:hypothetical protein
VGLGDVLLGHVGGSSGPALCGRRCHPLGLQQQHAEGVDIRSVEAPAVAMVIVIGVAMVAQHEHEHPCDELKAPCRQTCATPNHGKRLIAVCAVSALLRRGRNSVPMMRYRKAPAWMA